MTASKATANAFVAVAADTRFIKDYLPRDERPTRTLHPDRRPSQPRGRMSRPRVVTGVDERGRPVTAWADPEPADAPRYGFMEPAYDPGSIVRRRATPEELEAIAARDARPPALPLVQRPFTAVPVALEDLGPLVPVQDLLERFNGAEAPTPDLPPATEPPEEEPAMSIAEAPVAPAPPPAPEPSYVGEVLEEISSLAINAREAWVSLLDARGAAGVAAARWEESRDLLQRAYARLIAGDDVVGLTITSTGATVTHGLEPLIGTPQQLAVDVAAKPARKPAAAAPKRQPGHHPSKASEAQEKADRARKVMDAMARHGGDKRAVAAELGMKVNAVAMVVKHAGNRQAATA